MNRNAEDHRCTFTWNPGHWPYVKACKEPATTMVVVDGEHVWFCGTHATVVRNEIDELRRNQQI